MELALSWQDIVLTLGNITLLLAMVPEFMRRPKMPFPTSIPAMVAMLFFTMAYATVGLWAAAVASGITAILWCILVFDHPYFTRKRHKRGTIRQKARTRRSSRSRT